MARGLFPSILVELPGNVLAPNNPITFWAELHGGIQFTDITAPDGVTDLDAVTTDSTGMTPELRGPENIRTMYYDAGAGVRFPVYATDVVKATLDQFPGVVTQVTALVQGGGGGGGTVSGMTDAQITQKIGGNWTNLVPAVGLKADLDQATGKLRADQLPDGTGSGTAGAGTYRGAVATQVAMLALTAVKGDWCNRTDVGRRFDMTGTTPSSLASWTVNLADLTVAGLLPGVPLTLRKNETTQVWPTVPAGLPSGCPIFWFGSGTETPPGMRDYDERRVWS